MEFQSNQTIASQLVTYVKKDIFSGRYAAGQKLPPIREFAAQCGVNPNTVVKAYGELEAEGLIFTDSTLGKFVCRDVRRIESGRREYLKSRTELLYREFRSCGASDEEFAALTRGIVGGIEEERHGGKD